MLLNNKVRYRRLREKKLIHLCSVCLLSVAVACATASTCSLAWSAVPARVRIRAGARNYDIVKRIQALRYRINILGSQLSPSSVNLVPAQARKVTVGLASHWPCVTDNRPSGITTYGLMALGREMSTPPKLQQEYGTPFLLPVQSTTTRLPFVRVRLLFDWNNNPLNPRCFW